MGGLIQRFITCMGRNVRKPVFGVCQNKGADQPRLPRMQTDQHLWYSFFGKNHLN